jgi:hypothetical protein
VTVFADRNMYFFAVSDEITAVSIAIVRYVQTNESRMFAMKSWMSSAAWDPVSGGLYSNGQILIYMDHANDPSIPGWCMIPIFGELCLNDDGRLAAKRDRAVFVTFHLSCDPFFPDSMQPAFPLQRTGEAARAGKRTESRQISATSDHDPQIRFRATRPVPRESLLSPASNSSVGSSTSFASILGGVGAAHFRATASRGHKRKFGNRLPSLQSRPQGAHRRFKIS